MLLRPSRQRVTSVHVCVHVLVCACMFMSLRVRDNRMETEQEALSLITAACLSMCLSACACHRYACLRVSLWTCAYPYLDGRRVACQSTSGRVLHFSACAPRSINKGLCHNPNLTSPEPASEQHQWYMATSGRPRCYRFSAWWMETSAGQSIPNLSPTVLI